jgi:hypothetical protein
LKPFWLESRDSMPKLFAIVEKTCIKCQTSVASESSFSVGGEFLKAPNKGTSILIFYFKLKVILAEKNDPN